MKRFRHPLYWAGLAIVAVVAVATIAHATRPRPHYYDYPPVGIHFQMTEDFYRALNEEGTGETRKLTTEVSQDYLHQIAIATRYTVETNLAILKQQERIIQLLESMGGKAPSNKGGRESKAPKAP